MKKCRLIFSILILLGVLSINIAGDAAAPDGCEKLGQIFKTQVKKQGDICRLSIPRKDISLVRNGQKIEAEAAGLGFMVNFEQVGNTTAITGEFALLGNEVNHVIDALRKGGINISAIHNHMIGETPKIYFLHMQGTGDPVKLAKTIKASIATTNGDKPMHVVPLKENQ
ncbi:uncharacterized protein DUF1259 [Scopulibacillus darangshiensis]|uniref:Uncharacterized protein DUF1259 n=1 Tax=Scopulibacillus darangshiensis TaxID=442528 RepID=A0A4R2NWR0_9BACL|nr:DUF1259 domain-containing protein [Scopulibacillus darangshiensis]TCP26603.1 uncharacterized protein DUF1259 [Scopulibacillus darangshiensis]